MKTILVPVDFSTTAKNSSVYAVHIARELGAEKVVLYNAYSMPLATEMSWAVLQTEELQKASEKGLAKFKGELETIGVEGLHIEVISDFGFLIDRINDIATKVKADLIVMGITGGGKLEEVLMGSNTLHVVHHTNIPVLIVPPDAQWRDVQVVGWACDYKDVLKTTPSVQITNIITELKAKLVVMHNNPNPHDFNPDLFHNNVMVAELFKKLQPEFENTGKDDFLDAIQEFVQKHRVDMLLVMPRPTSWIQSLFKRSHTKMLAFHSHVPVLCLRPLH